MKFSKNIKSISQFKTHATEMVRDVVDNRETLIITQNGEAKVIVQDIHTYEEIQESLALLKMLAQSQKSVEGGRVKPIKKAFADVRHRIKKRKNAE